MQKTAISWTSVTWNPVSGCSKVSDGCKHCYAATIAEKFGHTSKPWTIQNEAENVTIKPDKLVEPFKLKETSRVFTNSMSDLFHRAIPDWYRAAVFAVMMATPHTYQCLTKRPEAMIDWPQRFRDAVDCPEFDMLIDSMKDVKKYRPVRDALMLAKMATTPWTRNIWAGASVEDARVLGRLEPLRACGAKIKFVSAEPLLGAWGKVSLVGIHWVIVGGESGLHLDGPENPRWMKQAWAREIRDLCVAQGVAFFYKQDSGKRTELRPYLVEEDGSKWEWHQMPGDLTPARNVDTGELRPVAGGPAPDPLLANVRTNPPDAAGCTCCTAQLGVPDEDGLNITVRSASTPEGQALAPTWEMVNGLKSRTIDEDGYRARYLALLRRRYADDPTPFLAILRRERVVLKCYCPAGAFCHRHIAVDVLAKIADSQGIAFTRGGEIIPAPVASDQLALF